MSNSDRQLPPCPEGNYYTIRAGDTLFSITQKFNISIDDLLEANLGLIEPDNLRVGQIICIPLAVPPRTCPPNTVTYIIQRGDTFYSISQRFDTTVEALIKANPEVSPDTLLIGQQICIPRGAIPSPEACPPGTFTYRIQSGDTFYSLARRYRTTVQAIQQVNPGVNPNALRIGQVICIPRVPVGRCPGGSFAYTIRSGDTLYNIARRFNTTIRSIVGLNPGIEPNRLRVGQIICIPREA
jgi:LysM repeat protein